MSFNINLIPEKKKNQIDKVLADEHLVKERAEGKHIQSNKTDMTEEEYQQMYNANYIDKGIEIVQIKCRKCGQVKEAAKSSHFYYTKVCSKCNRKVDRKKPVIEF